ncbi:MAG: hypothetical protein ACK41C_09225 [Phenylobacterium sp.]|uniref:hypothetical protein n=1 Tax=Phenylobacterium sp. TaxID=1871053 RepID=UPI003919B165
MLAAGAAAAQDRPTAPDRAFAATLASAWEDALARREAAAPLLSPEGRLASQAGYDSLTPPDAPVEAPAANAAAAAVDASVAQDAVARVSGAVTYEQLKAVGKANEQAAHRRPREAGRWDPPLQDEKGYYFDIVQTWTYRHSPRSDDVGLYPPEYYAALRCRAAPRAVGPLADNPNWKRSVFWRVCPDETGKYRPTM